MLCYYVFFFANDSYGENKENILILICYNMLYLYQNKHYRQGIFSYLWRISPSSICVIRIRNSDYTQFNYSSHKSGTHKIQM